MSNGSDSQAAQEYTEQRGKEKLFSTQLRDAERNAVKNIATHDHSSGAIFRIIDSACGVAETVYQDNRFAKTRAIACKEGCAWCCYQTVRVAAPEAFRIARFVQALGKTAREAVMERLRDLDKRTRGLTASARAKLREPCAFLKDNRCMIYPVRPMVCAEFTSFDVKDCERGYRVGFMHTGVTSERARTVVYGAVRAGLTQGLREALPEADTTPLELTAAVVDVLNSPDAAADWLSGGKVLEGAHLAEEKEEE
jgi:Fe-S-cluster containining protein